MGRDQGTVPGVQREWAVVSGACNGAVADIPTADIPGMADVAVVPDNHER